MKLPPGHAGEKMWKEALDGRHQSKSGKIKMWKRGNEFHLFISSSHFYCGVAFLHLFLFIHFSAILWCLPFLHLFSVVNFSTFALVCPVAVPRPFLHFSTFTVVSPILCLFSHFFSPMSWWQLSVAATRLASLPSLRTNHFPHHPQYNNASTQCLTFFLGWLTFEDRPDWLSRNLGNQLLTYAV